LLFDFFRRKRITPDRFPTFSDGNESLRIDFRLFQTLYVSPYFTVGKNGAEFTKHYYAGSQRLVSKLGNGRFNNHFRPGVYGLTAGGVNYIERMQSITQSREEYGIAPGPPHMKGIYADPNYSGAGYPDGGTPDNTYVPAGWPRRVIPLQDKDPNGPPGAPIQYYPAMSNETAEPGFAYEGAGQIEESGRYFYHGDHLGSTSFVTDARGRVSQYVAYMPYGEALFEEHSNTRDMPYLFNSKERDEETGLYYYGARYLDPETAVWYGVDPLAMKYPDYSPYVYCFNNPIKYIDPDGMDVWQIDVDGNIINRIEDKTQDAFHFGSLDADGNFKMRQVRDDNDNMVDVAISFEYGTVTNVFNHTVSGKDAKGNTFERNLTVFEIKGDDNATKLFEQMADPWQSTNVEWTHAKIETENNSELNMVGTSHQRSSTAVGGYLLSTGRKLKEVNHNHPMGNIKISPRDTEAAKAYHARNPNTILNIYTYPGNYHRFNQHGLINK
jgi:RHS repeat-associated protein